MKYLVTALMFLAMETLPHAASTAIQVSSVSLNAYVSEPYVAVGSNELLEAIPQVLSASNGADVNTTTVTWTTSASETIISQNLIHQREANYLSIADTSNWIYFTPTKDLAYSLSGFYDVTDASGNSVVLQYWLSDVTDVFALTLFENDQRSINTPNEHFVIGEQGGDSQNSLSGALTGLLTQGHLYELRVRALISAYPNVNDAGATASGNLTLSLTDPSAVPEPTQLAMWLVLGLCGAAVYRLRAQSAVA